MLDAIFQKDVVRKVKKWRKAVQAAKESHESASENTFKHSPDKTSVNTLEDAAALHQRKARNSSHHGIGAPTYPPYRHSDSQTPATKNPKLHKQNVGQRAAQMRTVQSHPQHGGQHDGHAGITSRQPIQNHQAPTPTLMPTPGMETKATRESVPWLRTDPLTPSGAASPTPIVIEWRQWRRMTPLQRQQHREQRMM